MTPWITTAMGGYPESSIDFRYALDETLRIFVTRPGSWRPLEGGPVG
jgi:hypothetical protein